jgi:hypothetical protein
MPRLHAARPQGRAAWVPQPAGRGQDRSLERRTPVRLRTPQERIIWHVTGPHLG